MTQAAKCIPIKKRNISNVLFTFHQMIYKLKKASDKPFKKYVYIIKIKQCIKNKSLVKSLICMCLAF